MVAHADHADRVGRVEERYTLTDALAVATYLHGFIRQCRGVRGRQLRPLVNAIAPIFTRRQGLFLQTIYHPLSCYAEHARPVALDVHVDEPQYALPPERRDPTRPGGRVRHVSDLRPFSLIDAVASCDEAGREITVALVNRDRDREQPATIEVAGPDVAGAVEGWEVNAAGGGGHQLVRASPPGGRAGAPRHARSGGLDYVCRPTPSPCSGYRARIFHPRLPSPSEIVAPLPCGERSGVRG